MSVDQISQPAANRRENFACHWIPEEGVMRRLEETQLLALGSKRVKKKPGATPIKNRISLAMEDERRPLERPSVFLPGGAQLLQSKKIAYRDSVDRKRI